MRKILLACCLIVAATTNAEQKNYVSGKMLAITASHSQTFYQGTSDDLYYRGYSVQIGDMIYSGWCREKLFGGCDTNFIIKAPVQVRLDGNHFYLLRSNGKEQKVTIGRREMAPGSN